MTSANHIALFRYMWRNRTVKTVLYVLLIVTLSLGVELVIWGAAKYKNIELRKEVKAERVALYNQEQLIRLNSHVDRVIPQIETIERKYKSTSSQSDVIKQIGDLARMHNLHVLSQSIQRSDNKDIESSVSTFEIKVSGRYADIRRMLGKLPALTAWVEVADIRLEKMNANSTSIGAQLRLFVIRERAQ